MGLFSRKKNQPSSSAASSRDVLDGSEGSNQEPAVASSEQLPTETAVAAGVPAQATAGAGLKAVVEKMRSKADGQVTLSLSQTGNEMRYMLYQRGQEIEAGIIEPGSEWFSSVADLYVEEEKSERGAWTRALIVINPALGTETAVQVSFMNTEVSRTHNLNYALTLGATSLFASALATDSDEKSETVEERLSRVSARLASDEAEGRKEEAPATELEAEEYKAEPIIASAPSVLSEEVSGESTSADVYDTYTAVESTEPIGESALAVDGEKADTVSEEDYVAQRFAHTATDDEASLESEEAQELETAPVEEVSPSPALTPVEEDAHGPVEAGVEDTLHAKNLGVEEETAAISEPVADAGTVHSESAGQYPVTGGHFEHKVETDALAAEEPLSGAEPAEEPSYILGEATSPEPVSDVPALLVAEHEVDTLGAEGQYVTEDLPSHIDDSEFGTDDEPAPSNDTSASVVPAAPSKIAAATLDAPMTGSSVDVAPSYSEQSYAKPSETKKADGNLILTEAEVVSRLAPAYDALFGVKGTALDVSTVLIRVRTLGSYYDALTHVRRNGFWEQVRTFDLIPEDVLAILQLKADSYKEGYGSPLAINLRFTPGIPVVASFDYADEEAFVRYPEHLPAQQYVEELRMFPRTGANIPAHMSEALASWNF